jgi:hypothetical protein
MGECLGQRKGEVRRPHTLHLHTLTSILIVYHVYHFHRVHRLSLALPPSLAGYLCVSGAKGIILERTL